MIRQEHDVELLARIVFLVMTEIKPLIGSRC